MYSKVPSLIMMALTGSALTSRADAADHLLSPLYADNMVVQRDTEITVGGQASAGTKVTVTSGAANVAAAAGKDGTWTAKLPARKAGDTFAIEVATDKGGSATIRNVVAGDVWLCSGQSNMDLRVEEAANAPQVEDRAGRYPIRIAKVERASVPGQTRDLQWDIPWQQADAKSVAGFSSVCWHMAENIAQAQPGVPLGLVHSAWGGTSIDDWVSAPAMRRAVGDGEALDLLALYARDERAAATKAVEATELWMRKAAPGDKGAIGWETEGLDDAGWGTIELPQMWEQAGITELGNFNGIVWFRRTFELTAVQARAPMQLKLERIDERDAVWVNGKLVGADVDPNEFRDYTVPADVLHAGANTIAIRVLDERGSGGFRAHADRPNNFAVVAKDGSIVPLGGTWKFKTGAEIRDLAPAPSIPWKAPRGLTTLYNGMVAPLQGMTWKGVAWYQGESDTGLEDRYKVLLPAMIADWRRTFGQPELPFVVAQLPGFGALSTKAGHSNWAELREAERLTAANDPLVGLAVLIDLGVPSDIHPRHKSIAGERMASEALRVAYGQTDLPVAPYPVSVTRTGDGVTVGYAANAGLHVFGAKSPSGFQVCVAPDACTFVDASVDDDRVVLTAVPAGAKIVRYAWQESPLVNLYGKADLPAAPFAIEIDGK